MYVMKILLLEVTTLDGGKSSNIPDRVFIETIFDLLHTSQHFVSPDYKYIIDFPALSSDSLGMQLNLFSEKKEDLTKHIKIGKLKRLILDNCLVEIEEVNKLIDYECHNIKVSKEEEGLGLSKIKRLIKRKNGEVYSLFMKGMSENEIFNKLKQDLKSSKKQFIRYKSKNNQKIAHLFIESKETSSCIFDFNKVNSFGFGNPSTPKIYM